MSDPRKDPLRIDRKNPARVRTWQVEQIEQGLRELDRGEGIPHDDILEWLESRIGKPGTYGADDRRVAADISIDCHRRA